MKRETAAQSLKSTGTVFIIIGIILLCIGFYKITAYENESSSLYNNYSYDDDEDSINAYVGGDAYNYIINGTYFTAFAVMGTGCLIIATITKVAAMFMLIKDEKNVVVMKDENVVIKSEIEDIEANLPKM